MNPGVVVAIVVPCVLLIAGLVGWVIKYLIGRYEREVAARGEDRKEYERRLNLLDQALDLKTETIQDLRRQVSELHITAQLQDKFLSRLPPSPHPARGE